MTALEHRAEGNGIAGAFDKPMHRRSLVKALAGAGAVALTLGAIGPAAAADLYTVSANANFRSGPGTNYAIISVIAKGSTFQVNGQSQNGYAGVIYGGKTGWVLASLIVAAGSSTPPILIGRSVTTTANVNLRSGPGTSYAVLKVVPSGSKVATTPYIQNGFRYVAYNGLLGWISTTYLSA